MVYRQPVVSSADFMSPASIYPPHPCAREDRDRAQIVPEIDDVGSVTCCCCCSLSAYYSYRDLASPIISHLAPQGLLQRRERARAWHTLAVGSLLAKSRLHAL